MKKVYKILLIALLIIIMNITIINADSEIPATNAETNIIMNFTKNHTDENDEVWNNVTAETIEKWIDTLAATKRKSNNNGLNAGITSMTNVLKKVSDKKKKEKEEAEKLIADAEKYNKKLEIAYKTIPASDADAETINKFIKSDIQYNKSEQFLNEKISLELARTWSNTLNKAQTDNLTIKQYEDSKRFLNEYVNKLNGKSTDEDLKNSMNDVAEEAQKTIEANNQTIKNAKIKLSILAGSKGTTRTENVFKDDVLDDPNTYKPSNSNSKDDSEAATIIDKILSLITTIGTVISVLMLAILGVKYMLGSIEEKAEYKKDLVPYFIGAALLFGICTVVKILQSLGDTINNL